MVIIFRRAATAVHTAVGSSFFEESRNHPGFLLARSDFCSRGIKPVYIRNLLLASLLLATFGFAKDRELRKGALIPTNEVATDFASESHYAGDSGVLMFSTTDPVYIRFDGTKSVWFHPNQTPDLNGKSYIDGSACSDGSDVYLLTYERKKMLNGDHAFSIARYDLDGKFLGVNSLDFDLFQSQKMAAIGNDRVLISGTVKHGDLQYPERVRVYPFIGIFSSNGQFLREIQAPHDIQLWHDNPLAPKRSLLDLDNGQIEEIANASFLDRANTGDVILVRHSAIASFTQMAPIAFVIHPSLEIERLVLPKPENGYLVSVKVVGPELVAFYVESQSGDASEKSHGTLRVVNVSSGKIVHSYRVDLDTFGEFLISWSRSSALFATQTGTRQTGIRLAFIEALP